MSDCPLANHSAHLLAADQHGIITLGELERSGVLKRQRVRWLRDGTLERLHREVYRFRGAPRTWEAAVMGNVLAAGPDAVASRGTAARLHGLSRAARTSPIEVTRLSDRRRNRKHVIVHGTCTLPEKDVTTVLGIRCTSGARTVVDLAGCLRRAELMALVDDAICSRVATRTALHERAVALANGRAKVNVVARITHPDAEGEFWSWLERTFGTHVRRNGLPQPAWNAPVRDATGFIGYADAWFQPFPVLVELHGLAFHRQPAARQRDERKRNRATLMGLTVLTFDWYDLVTDSRGVLAQVHAALVAAGWSERAGTPR